MTRDNDTEESETAACSDSAANILQAKIRPATAEDAVSIDVILSTYFLDREDVPHERFLVAEIDVKGRPKIIGCAVYDQRCSVNFQSFYEIHTIAVLPSYKNKGVGAQLLLAMSTDILCSGSPALSTTIYTRTTSPEFFINQGFSAIDDSEKKELWTECRDCQKFESCVQKALSKIIKHN
ncbi:hypothetical protein MsAg5_06890 [Methanosarcinaceae archaeon Ag5]|uniref:N-acetyltransferase domain-containing protein n=1 Tax=Methanolapillus africanus TaxID=3028297 RepID=A0AAE4SCU6_9EURY|nr:hypothetical protein [Methanosarcinaceae archaeon Ag5]